jgi:hypothetical protein
MVREPGHRPGDDGRSGNGQGARETMAETATAAAESIQFAATQQIEQQKQAASQSIQAFAQAVRRASDELSKQDQTTAAQVIQQAAGGLENLSHTLSNQSLGEMVSSARDFGRRNPMALAGGAALLGLALGRMARTASARSNGSDEARRLPAESSRGDTQTASGPSPATRASTAPTPAAPSRAGQVGGKSSGGNNE